jgi:hypothetical protein
MPHVDTLRTKVDREVGVRLSPLNQRYMGVNECELAHPRSLSQPTQFSRGRRRSRRMEIVGVTRGREYLLVESPIGWQMG